MSARAGASGEDDGGGSWPGRAERGCTGDLDALGAEARLQHLGWLLARGHGYLVRGLGDEPLGRLAALSYGSDDRWPRALVLRPRGLRGLWSRTTCELSFSAVLAVAPARREVRVISGAAGPAGGAWERGSFHARARWVEAPGPARPSRSPAHARPAPAPRAELGPWTR